MRYEFKKSFDKSTRGLSTGVKISVKKLAFEIVDLVSSGKKPSKGVGLTRLRKDYWEARTTIHKRILFRLAKDRIQFIFVGDHTAIKRFLKRI